MLHESEYSVVSIKPGIYRTTTSPPERLIVIANIRLSAGARAIVWAWLYERKPSIASWMVHQAANEDTFLDPNWEREAEFHG